MAPLLDRFGDDVVLETCATQLEDAVFQLEQQMEALDRSQQTEVLRRVTERFLNALRDAEIEAVQLQERVK